MNWGFILTMWDVKAIAAFVTSYARLFLLTYKSYNGKKATPTQRLGITDKQFEINEIIYFK